MSVNFTVLMSVYNNEKPCNLVECFDSLQSQSLKCSELVLVEDGVISNSLKDVVEKYRNVLNIQSVILRQNQGLAFALNEGLKFCKYELIARMDSDDIAMPNRFEVQVAFMLANPLIVASSAYIEEFDELGDTINQRELPIDHESICKFAKKRSPLSHPVAIFRKKSILDVGGYPLFRKAQDYALWSMLIVNGCSLANIPVVLLRMRTGSQLMQRRGFSYFLHERKLLKFQYRIGLLVLREYYINLFSRFVLRVAPARLKSVIYKYLR